MDWKDIADNVASAVWSVRQRLGLLPTWPPRPPSAKERMLEPEFKAVAERYLTGESLEAAGPQIRAIAAKHGVSDIRAAELYDAFLNLQDHQRD